MTRLIDADALIDALNSKDLADWLSEQEEYTPASIVEHVMETLPTVEAEPVKYGKLLNASPYGECSICGCLIDSREGFNYCPNCGARLVGGEW